VARKTQRGKRFLHTKAPKVEFSMPDRKLALLEAGKVGQRVRPSLKKEWPRKVAATKQKAVEGENGLDLKSTLSPSICKWHVQFLFWRLYEPSSNVESCGVRVVRRWSQ